MENITHIFTHSIHIHRLCTGFPHIFTHIIHMGHGQYLVCSSKTSMFAECIIIFLAVSWYPYSYYPYYLHILSIYIYIYIYRWCIGFPHIFTHIIHIFLPWNHSF